MLRISKKIRVPNPFQGLPSRVSESEVERFIAGIEPYAKSYDEWIGDFEDTKMTDFNLNNNSINNNMVDVTWVVYEYPSGKQLLKNIHLQHVEDPRWVAIYEKEGSNFVRTKFNGWTRYTQKHPEELFLDG